MACYQDSPGNADPHCRPLTPEIAILLRSLTLLALLWVSSRASAGETTWTLNASWLEQQISACAGGHDPGACRYFPARALDRLFGVEQLCDGDTCAHPWRVAELTIDGDAWSPIGAANDQAALTTARKMATGGLPVVAIHGGMVALIMPGQPFPSQRWRRNVPLAVGTRVDDPEASVYGKGLNFLFSDPAQVTLYVHK